MKIHVKLFCDKDSGRAADLVAELHACFCDNDINSVTGYPTRPKTGAVRGESRENEINAM